MTAIVASAIAAGDAAGAPSLRNIVLFPARYLDQKITIVGQFAGRNLLGDLPDAPARSRYDFVLRSADAAIWVSNLRPRGKDFELALDARIDTGRWLEVTGTLQQGRGLQWLDGEANSLKLVKPPTQTDRRSAGPGAGRAAARSHLQRADRRRNRRRARRPTSGFSFRATSIRRRSRAVCG